MSIERILSEEFNDKEYCETPLTYWYFRKIAQKIKAEMFSDEKIERITEKIRKEIDDIYEEDIEPEIITKILKEELR